MKELLRGESTISLEAAVLKCPNAELYLYLTHKQYTEQYNETEYTEQNIHNNKNT
jgi:hypothetical protein